MNTDLIPVNVLIGDRTYRLKIIPAEEEQVRKNIKVINEKIVDFKTNFAGKDMQDYIAMALLWFATDYENTPPGSMDAGEMKAKLSRLQEIIEKGLANN